LIGMAYPIRSTRGLARFVSDLHETISAYPGRPAAASGHEDLFRLRRLSVVYSVKGPSPGHTAMGETRR
jgi:hypothetical protein